MLNNPLKILCFRILYFKSNFIVFKKKYLKELHIVYILHTKAYRLIIYSIHQITAINFERNRNFCFYILN